MAQGFFITSSGTGVGKTLVTAALSWQLRAADKKVIALKPVISGYDPDDEESDTAILLKSCGIARTVEQISPWRFNAPLAPAMAAEKEGRPVESKALLAFCEEQAEADYILVEGAGGVMSPLNEHMTMLDWMNELRWPVILVVGSYLGAISHALSAYAMLEMHRLALGGIVISESADSSVAFDETCAMLEKFLPKGIPTVRIPRIATTTEPWKHVSSLNGIWSA